MEIFNSKFVLASPETASDADYAAILGVISHEYFHNWTGNRVTCCDWFQLSLKEGLTVFRDQDAGPMAHPVRPHSYIKMDNFYTVTVYDKGAEVVRMYKTLLGNQGFRKGMDLYFKRHDGQAVTCKDFFAAMRDANDADFSNFLLWYSQTGTPLVKVTSSYHAEAQTYSLKFRKKKKFVFSDISERPFPSLLRVYSAPIRLDSDLTESDLFFLLAHDSNEFNRWEAGQILGRKLMLSLVADFQANKPLVLNPKFVHGLKSILFDSSLDKVVNKWFALQAMSDIPENVENVRNLLKHPAFDLCNPNKVYSLIGGFCGSPVNFHAKDGSGYKFLGEMVVQLDKLNSQVASRLVSAFSRWKRYDET